MPLVNDLVTLFDETPGILLSSAAAEELAEDVQAVVIRHALNSPNRAALGKQDDESFKHAVEDVYVSHFGVTLYNLVTLCDFPEKRIVLPSARKAIVEAMIAAMLLEQTTHAPLTLPETSDELRKEPRRLSRAVELECAVQHVTAASALEDFGAKGC
jgi:hypothetical protein